MSCLASPTGGTESRVAVEKFVAPAPRAPCHAVAHDVHRSTHWIVPAHEEDHEPFGQADAGLTRRYDGVGLGLPRARFLAELHGGALRIESRKGVGTTVTVSLPAGQS